jgi:K+-transporting ATPase ATPase B chain
MATLSKNKGERQASSVFTPQLMLRALGASFARLNPFWLRRNVVMLVVEIGSAITTVIAVVDVLSGRNVAFVVQVSLWLWFTVVFANFAEALAEAQGNARAESLRRSRTDVIARRLLASGQEERVPAPQLRKDDVILISDGEAIAGDGEIIEGTSLVDESAITGESAPVIRESGGDRSGVTGGSRVLSGKVRVRITANPGETFLDSMIKMVESAKRQKTPNEIALEILLIGMTILFILVVFSLPAFAHYMHVRTTIPVLMALLVCLMPTTIGGLLPAIGIAGMVRLIQHNLIALSGRAVEAAGDVDTVLLDKTGTITLGNRMATELIAADGISREVILEAAMLSSLSDETPEGRSIVILCKNELGVKGRDIRAPDGAVFVPFSARTRMSGIDVGSRQVRKGSVDAVEELVKASPRTAQTASSGDCQPGRHTARRSRVRPRNRYRPAQGRPEEGHQGPAGHASPTRHQVNHDYRRQSPDRGFHCRGSRARRFRGPGSARDEAGADSKVPGRRAHARHDWRRNERCTRARPGRCRGGDERRHPGRA